MIKCRDIFSRACFRYLGTTSTLPKRFITGCALAQHCYNGDVRFLWESLELWPPVKFKPLNRLSENLSQLIISTRGTFAPSLVKIRSWGTSGQIGEMSLSFDFFFWGTRRDQTLWPILTHDGSKCAESRKDMPFGVKIFNFNIWPLFTPKMSNFAPKIAISSQNDETWKSKYIRN